MVAPPVISGIKTRPFVDNRHYMKLTLAYRFVERANGVRVCVETLSQFKLMGATGALIII
jgi:hypothetical protein